MYQLLLTAATLLTAVSAAYCLLCIITAVLYIVRRRPLPVAASLPPLSILKPLKGTDPEMYQSLCSHCIQNYPEYEILFGISDPGDPSAEIVKRLQKEFPDHIIQLVHCGKNLGANGKVSTLAQLAAIAKHDVFLINDSDIRVEPDYLRTLAIELQQP